MKCSVIILLAFFLPGCHEQHRGKHQYPDVNRIISSKDSIPPKSYTALKQDIETQRKLFRLKYPVINDSAKKEMIVFWVNAICNDLYGKWENTPWDFNGTSTQPGQGSIACGYFVTTLLRDMGLAINRVKLATCASSQMMKSLVPQQKIKNLSYLDDHIFYDTLAAFGKGVYIIGLDFHTGFIVNDGQNTWFIHSNYIGRKGVTREAIAHSEALLSSKTRWVVSLTGDQGFLEKWLHD